jgi:hypothetical protein
MGYGEFARLTATPLDRAVDSAIARENAAVIEEQRTGQHVSTPDRQFLNDILSAPLSDEEEQRFARILFDKPWS